MNDKMQQQFVHITNTSKPNLEQIKEHTFEAAERYITQSKKGRSIKDATLVSAVAVNYKKENKFFSNFENVINKYHLSAYNSLFPLPLYWGLLECLAGCGGELLMDHDKRLVSIAPQIFMISATR